jgi:hypothetical protein
VVVGNFFVWNALEIIIINHRLYLNMVTMYGWRGDLLKTQFKIKLQCLNECSEVIEFFEDCEFDIDSFEDPHVGLQTPR